MARVQAMLRRGAPLFPRATLALAGLAVGALAQAMIGKTYRGVDNAVAVLRAGMRSQASRAQVECLELLAGQAGVALRNGTLIATLKPLSWNVFTAQLS